MTTTWQYSNTLMQHNIYPRAQASRVIGERSEPLSRVFNDQPRDIYGGVRTYVQNASCYFSKLKLRSPIIVRMSHLPLTFKRLLWPVMKVERKFEIATRALYVRRSYDLF